MDINIQDLRNGDCDARNRAYEALCNAADSACWDAGSDFDDAEREAAAIEAVRRTMIRYEQTVDDFEELKNICKKVARRVLQDLRRKNSTWKRGGRNATESLEAQPETHEPADDNQPPPDQRALWKDLRFYFERLLDQIPEKQAVAVRGSFFDDLGQREIAELGNMSIKSVGVHLKRGLDALRRLTAGELHL